MRSGASRCGAPLVALVAVLGSSACGKKVDPPALPRAEPFIAFERDFQGFRDWREVDLPKLEAQGVTHTEGKAREYVNAFPAPGRSSFAVGTIIVKEVTNEEKKTHEVFAMVKRGGGYNRSGAPGWEWFELHERPDESIAIVWRGINAPNGESYAGDPLGGCNSCHQLAAKNDFVKTATLALAGASAKLARD
jgi:hypothetical protein